MFSFQIRTRQDGGSPDSPKPAEGRGSSSSVASSNSSTGSLNSSKIVEVGEIDTRAPFESVRAAMSLFGDLGASTSPKAKFTTTAATATGSKKLKLFVEERVLEKETQLHLALKELDDFRIRLRNTENTNAQAHRDLGKANKTLQELTSKLELVSESKQTAIETAEAAKQRAQELEEQKSSGVLLGGDAAWKQEVDNERDQYKTSAAEIISIKQELTTLRQDFDIALEAKLAAFQQAEDAQHCTQVNQVKLAQLSDETSKMRRTLGQVNLASLQSQQEQEQQNAESQARIESHKTTKEEVDKKIKSLKEEYDTELNENFERKLEEMTGAAKVLEEQLENVKGLDKLSLANATSELDDAKQAQEQILEEENSLRRLTNSLKLELDNIMKEHSELKSKALEAELEAANLKARVEKNKAEIEAALAVLAQMDSQDAYDEMQLKLQELTKGAENDRQEAEEMKNSVSLLKQEAERANAAARDAEERLQVALKEAEEAKAAAKQARDMIHNSPNVNSSNASNSESNGKIKLSVEEFESLSKKIEASAADADVKVATIMAQIETIKTSEDGALKNLEANTKENNELEVAIQDALKQAEMAEAAKQVVEGELMKWREKEDEAVGQSSNIHEATMI